MYRTDKEYYIWLVDVLRQAYMNDTLEAGSPCGCGVGNIVMAAAKEEGFSEFSCAVLARKWTGAFCTNSKLLMFSSCSLTTKIVHNENKQFRQTTTINRDTIMAGQQALSLIKIPIPVLRDMEWQFEITEETGNADETMFNRLMACISVLDKYFGIPPIIQEKTKEEFINVRASLCNKKREKTLQTI